MRICRLWLSAPSSSAAAAAAAAAAAEVLLGEEDDDGEDGDDEDEGMGEVPNRIPLGSCRQVASTKEGGKSLLPRKVAAPVSGE